jgi:predicted nucleotide-binding protein (sugar kinase/HSP70/actin superfamily)
MVITVPRMGNTCLAAKVLFDELKIPYVLPEKNNRNTLKIGSGVSPEEICLPFKIMMGNYLESLEKGADTILITGSCGPCRFGEYCEMQMKILKKLGYDIKMIVIDSPSSIGIKTLLERVMYISRESEMNKVQKFNSIKKALAALKLADSVKSRAYNIAGYEIRKGETKSIINGCESDIYNISGYEGIKKALNNYYKKLGQIEKDGNRRPLKVALIGEIYSMIEPFSNFFIEEKLMDYGVSTKRLITPSWWIKDLFLKPLKINSITVKRESKKYLLSGVGGHAKESIAHAAVSGKNGFDGVIQIFPVGCMPEIITKSLLPVLQRDYGLSVMTLVIDEMSGEAGLITRIEAFLDMLYEKRKKGVLRA